MEDNEIEVTLSVNKKTMKEVVHLLSKNSYNAAMICGSLQSATIRAVRVQAGVSPNHQHVTHQGPHQTK